MEGAFDNIFSALQKSEEIAQSKRLRSKEVKEAIEKLKAAIHAQRTSLTENEIKRNDLENNLADTTIGLKLLKRMEEGFAEDLDVLNKELQNEKEKYDEISSQFGTMCQESSEQVTRFFKDYGLMSMGVEERENSAKEQRELLNQETESLTSELQQLTNRLTTLKTSLDLRSQLLTKLQDLEGSIEKEEVNLRQQSQHLMALTQRNKELADEPDNGEEFCVLARKQQLYDTNDQQLKAREHQNELKLLTQELKRREGQVLQSQYRDWRRQRHQSWSVGGETSDNLPGRTTSFDIDHDNADTESSFFRMAVEDEASPDFILISSQEESKKQIN